MEKTAKKILIVDDEVEICKLISLYLKQKKFSVFEAHNGVEAQGLLSKIKPDLIVLDVVMPKMDGFTFLKSLKKDPSTSQIPVIMLTVKSQPKNVGVGIALKAEFYLAKPFKLNNLMNFINLIL